MKPTVIGGGNAPAPLQPTRISVPAPEPEMAAVRVSKPSAMPGSARERIPATRETLRVKHQIQDSVLDAAVLIIQATNQDEITVSDAVRWGQPLQERYSALVDGTLKLAQSEVIMAVSGHVNRMLEILGNIRLEKVFERGLNAIANFLRRTTAEIDTPEELDDALREIGQLSEMMRGRIDELVSLREKLDSNSKQISNLGDDIEASMVAALAVAEHLNLQISRKDIAERLQERADSLTATLGQIRSGGSIRDIHVEQPMKLTSLVQEVVFNTLPSWVTGVTALRMSLHGSQKPNPTEVGEIGRMLKNIINKIA